MRRLAKFFKKFLQRFNIEIRQILWKRDETFASLYPQIFDKTVVSPDRIYVLYQFAKHALNMGGDVAEVGVYRGGTAKILSEVFVGKNIHLFDTFSGMPKVDASIDMHKSGDFAATSLNAVKIFLSAYSNIKYHPGFFPETAHGLNDLKFCFVHIDVDIYQSIKDAIAYFYAKTFPGGVLIFDDYDTPGCPGVKKAVDEFLEGKAETPMILARGQCVVIKKTESA